MTAVDTDVLVRLLTGDEVKQAAAARSLFAKEPIWIAKTVLLEAEWVLRSLYGFEQNTVREAFVRLLGLDNVRAEDEASVAVALSPRAARRGIRRRSAPVQQTGRRGFRFIRQIAGSAGAARGRG